MQRVDLRRFLMAFVRMVYRVPPEIVGEVRKDAAALTAIEAGSGQRVYTFRASDGDFDEG